MKTNKNGKCYICGAGDLTISQIPLHEEDFLIAVDGGVDYCLALELTPDLVIGDFDSISEDSLLLVKTMEEADRENVVRLKPEKDDTDMLAAINLALEMGFKDFRIYAGMGGRFDHSFANIQVLLYLKNHDACGYLVDGTGMTFVIKNEAIHLNKNLSGYLSLFSLSKTAEKVNISGLKYCLKDYTMTNDFPIGISNEFIGEEAQISVEDGELVCIIQYD